jgi:hypothetical protein
MEFLVIQNLLFFLDIYFSYVKHTKNSLLTKLHNFITIIYLVMELQSSLLNYFSENRKGENFLYFSLSAQSSRRWWPSCGLSPAALSLPPFLLLLGPIRTGPAALAAQQLSLSPSHSLLLA